MTSDGATWYYATDGLVHRIFNGVETTVNPREILPSTVSLSRVVALPNNGVAFSTTNYDNGWANAGVYYITVDGVASYVASDSTNCASYLVAHGTDSVVVSNWYGLTVINYVTGDVSYLPQWSQNYAMIVPSNDGYLYFVDRYDATLLHRYDGATGDSANYTDMRFTGMNWQGAVVINGVLYSFDNPSWNVYILQGVNLGTGVATLMVDFANVMETPRIMGYTNDGSLVAATSYNLLTIAALLNLG